MLSTLVDARERVLVGLGLALLLWLLGRGAGALVRRRYLALERPSFAHVMARVVALALSLLGILIAITVVFPTIKPVNLLSSLGFVSIAVGFAFRDILENLLAGVLLLFRAPFRTHDEVEVGDTRGTVIEINLRETVLRTHEGRRVLIPNATVYKNPITVQTGYDSVRDEATVRVAHATDLAQARDVALQALTQTDGVLADPPPLVLIEELGGRTIDVRLLFWTTPRQAEVRRVRDEVLRRVWRAYGDARIEMPTDILQIEGSDSLGASLRAAFQQQDEQHSLDGRRRNSQSRAEQSPPTGAGDM